MAPVTSTASATIHVRDDARVAGPFVPAGTRFTAVMDRALDTIASARGEAFSAVISQPLQARDGGIVVPAGSRITGHVNSIQGVNGPRLQLDFDGVQTVAGFSPIRARVDAASAQRYLGPVVPYGGGPLGDAWYGTPYYGFGGGPSDYLYDAYRPLEVHLPVGAALSLELTRPLLGPGARMLR